MGEALVAARLLLSETPEEATALAAELEAANTSRRDLTKTTITEARAILAGAGAAGEGTGPGEASAIATP